MASYRDLLQQVRSEIDEVDARGASQALAESDPPALLDVRELQEWQEGHIPGAVHVPRGYLESQVEQVIRIGTGRSSCTAPADRARHSRRRR